ncbi:hypothetical protein TNCV_2180581 [Trichonephila clavipes]|uniref:Uncharacterized protein n=1 Tax=Trichonephila clavipes TaxID=2585209 RepID=A0A8X6VUR3_TRICX|nr:hypothetical protein TNCV_2180581 [Trichonephila clavipes]
MTLHPMRRATPERALSSPNYHITPTEGRLSSRFNGLRCPTRWVFGGTWLELVTRLAKRSDTLTTRLPWPLSGCKSEREMNAELADMHLPYGAAHCNGRAAQWL